MIKQIWLASLLITGGVPTATGDTLPDPVTMIIISDPHYIHPSLYDRTSLSGDIAGRNLKLLAESDELLKTAVQMALRSGAELVLVPGDLTKDGALASHTGFADHLAFLEEQGLEVFVVPGNHDINNGQSFAFRGDSTVKVENVDPQRFGEIYAPYGYDQAIFRDSSTLSYVAEPLEGLWIIGIDPCLYDLNDPDGPARTDGKLPRETLLWLERVLETPRAGEVRKIAMMHHSLLEHYRGQNRFFNEQVVDNHHRVSRLMARNGVRVVFTGHCHASDITLKKWNDGSFLYDVETGSLVTYPCPIRKISLTGDSMRIETWLIWSIPSREDVFQDYAKYNAREATSAVVGRFLQNFGFTPCDAVHVASQVGDAFTTHCAGDEVPRHPPLDLRGLPLLNRLMIQFRKGLVRSLYQDLTPPDNEIVIDLASGDFR